MSQQELLIGVANHLDKLEIRYMLTGSIASSLYGEPRLTHDIDMVVHVTAQEAAQLATAFPPPRYYLDDRQSIQEVIDHASMFNLIDTSTGDKVDFWILTDSPFDRSRFERRRRVCLFDTSIWVSSPEDIILAKLRWAQLSGGSEKQCLDALHVYEVQHADLDLGYCETWARALGIAPLWEKLLGEAEIDP